MAVRKDLVNNKVDVICPDNTIYSFTPECDINDDIALWAEVRERVLGQ